MRLYLSKSEIPIDLHVKQKVRSYWYLRFSQKFLMFLLGVYGGAHLVALVTCGHLWNYNWLHYLRSHFCKLIGAGLDRNYTENPLMWPFVYKFINQGFQKLPTIQEWQYCHLCFSRAIWNLIGHQNFLAWNIILLYLVIYNFAFTKTIWLELSRKLQMCTNTQMAILSILSLLSMLFICWKPRFSDDIVNFVSNIIFPILSFSWESEKNLSSQD